MNPRVATVLAVILLATSAAAVAVWRLGPEPCVDEVVSTDGLTRPLGTDESDERLQRLVSKASTWSPHSEPVAWLGYDHNRFLDLAALPGRLAVWRKGEPVMTVIDAATADPVWGIRQGTARHTWDASAERFVMLAAPRDRPVEVSAHAMTSGRRTWCVRLDQAPLSATDPITTSVDADGTVWVLAGKPGHSRLTVLAADDGKTSWSRTIVGVDRGDYLSTPWDGVRVIGGRPAHELGEPASSREAIAGVDESGDVVWRHRLAEGSTASITGDTSGQVVVRESRPEGHRLVMLDQATGKQQWSRSGIDPTADIVVRGPVVLVRTATALSALDLGTGKQRWQTPVRQQPQQFPYGFRLAEQPMPDADHVLLGATDALIRVRLRDGNQTRLELPTDGISTTYWPYRVALNETAMAVATNTGTVVVGRP